MEFSYDFEGEERLTNEGTNKIIQSYIDKLPEVDRIILKEFYLKEKKRRRSGGNYRQNKALCQCTERTGIKKK